MIRHLYISLLQQRLYFFHHGRCQESFIISTAKNGPGEMAGSYCTPRGWHAIAAIIGLNSAINTVFKARQTTGQIYNTALEQEYPNQDWILTRILRLTGKEIGFNQGGGCCDTYQRFIYLHGCPDNCLLGTPTSQGCVRMRNHDIIKLADFLQVGDSVFLSA